MRALTIQRILFFVLSAAFVLGRVYVLLVYVAIYYASFEYLNSNKKYRELPLRNIYNWLFITYLAFIVMVRSKLFHFSPGVDFHLNTAEHLFFMFLICQTVGIYMQLFDFLPGHYLLKLITIFLLLNFIGIINEYFQNFYNGLPLFLLEENDLKDLTINFIGSSLFVIVSIICNRKKIRKFNT
ncbi:MAG: hypothetical protein QM710_13960 [Flavobacterium sp.]